MNLKRLVSTLFPAIGAAMLFMVSYLVPIVSPYHALLYHSVLPMSSVVWGVLIDLAVLTFLTTLLFSYLQERQSGLRILVWVLIAGVVVHRIAGGFIDWGWNIPHFVPLAAAAATFTVALVLWWLRPAAYRAVVGGLLALLFLIGCSAVWMVPELFYLALRPNTTAAGIPVPRKVLAKEGSYSAADGRIVWLLFDELSYEQTFDHRFAGLSMPNFDQLKNESVVFSDLKPVGYSTNLVIPSFFIGKRVGQIRSNLDGEPMLRLVGNNQWEAFDPHATLFSDAKRLGWTTGLVGWFNPYCRILAGTLDSCFWRMGDGQLSGPMSTKTSFDNAISPIQNVVGRLERKPGFRERAHVEDLAAILPAATALIRDESIRFVFIHLPVPHPPGIYDRKAGTVRPSGSYIDNLALSDRVLGELMKSLNATSLASKTTVILCSDHPWRLNIWRPGPLWTKEDEAATHGHSDSRPVLMIHFPGQQAGSDVSTPFEEIRIHELIESMLRGQGLSFEKALGGNATGSPIAAKP